MSVPRLRAIALLLFTAGRYLDDFGPKGAQYGSLSGAGPARKEKCRRCEGVGRSKGKSRCGMCFVDGVGSHGCEVCAECKGRGVAWYDPYLEAKRKDELSPQLVEAQDETAKRTSGGKARKRTIEPKGLDASIHRVAAARNARDREGSYRALEAAMRRLENVDEVSAYLLRAHYSENRWGLPSDMLEPIHLENGRPKPNVKVASLPLAHELAILRGLRLLDSWLPALNLPRDVLVKELDQGQSVSKMQERTGLSKRAIRRARRAA